MDVPTVTVRCPSCGAAVRAVLASTPPTQWFPCPHCRTPMPVVVPRDPPPLYSWEVYPGLYPTLPRPRPPRWRARPAVAAALVGVVVLAIAFAGVFVFEADAATAPASYVVSGTVYAEPAAGAVGPAAGARVVLTEDSGAQLLESTAGDGSFLFRGVPSGGVVLNVSLAGYSTVTVTSFASPVYDAGTQGISVTLLPGSASSVTTRSLSPFPDLETFLASLGGAALLLAVVAAVAGLAAWITWRSDRPPIGVVGGGAGLVGPVALYLLGLAAAFPLLLAATAALSGLGAFALGVRTVQIAQSGDALTTG